MNTAAQDETASVSDNYTFETIDVPGVDFLALTASSDFGNAYSVKLTKGLNMLSVPLASRTPMNAKSFAGLTGATVVIALDAENQTFVGWTPNAPNDGFAIEGGQGYIVNVPQPREFAIT